MKVSQRLRQREQAASTRRVWQHTTAVKARKTHGAYPDGGCGVFNHRSKPMADEQGSAEGRRQTHSVHTRVRHARRNVTTATRRSEGAIRRDDDASSQRKPLEGPHQLGNDPPPDEAIHRGAVLFWEACPGGREQDRSRARAQRLLSKAVGLLSREDDRQGL